MAPPATQGSPRGEGSSESTPFSYTPSSTSPGSGPSPVGSWGSSSDLWGGMGAEQQRDGLDKKSPRGPVPKQRAMFGTQRGLAAAVVPPERRGPPPVGFISRANPPPEMTPPPAADGDTTADTGDAPQNDGAPAEENPMLSPRGGSSGPKGDKRTHIVNEIVSTEKNYIQSIELLVKVFQPALKILINDPNTALKVEDVRRMFANIDMIIPLNKELLKDLEARVATWGPNQLIGDVFLIHAPYLKMYTDYSNNYNAANKLYLDLIANDLPFYEVMEVRFARIPAHSTRSPAPARHVRRTKTISSTRVWRAC